MFDCYYSYNGIDAVLKAKLEKLGARVPFNSIDHSLNTFFYLPVGVTIPNHLFMDTPEYYGEISDAEVDKHCSKSLEVSKIKPRDIVVHKTYKDLPMEVLEVGDTTSHLRIKLRNYETSITLNNSDLKLLTNHLEQDAEPVEYSAIPSFQFERLLDGYIVIDCDMFDSSEYTNLFNISLRVKASYSKLNIVVLNPLAEGLEFARDLGLFVAYGFITDVLDHLNDSNLKLYVITNKHYVRVLSDVINIELGEFIREVDYKLFIAEEYGIKTRDLSLEVLEYVSRYIQYFDSCKGQLFAPNKPRSIIDSLQRSNDVFDHNRDKIKTMHYVSEVRIIDFFDNYRVADLSLIRKFESLGLKYISSNMEYYSRIIKS